MNSQRRILLLSDRAIYIIAIEKNPEKDKQLRAKKPWIYVEKRRIEHQKLAGKKKKNFFFCQFNFFFFFFE
jgi:hypothetical protein